MLLKKGTFSKRLMLMCEGEHLETKGFQNNPQYWININSGKGNSLRS